jgi:cell division septation protein DedD
MIRRSLLLAAAIIACATAAHAQDTTLDRVQNLAASGRFTEARTTLEQWERSFADPRSNATPADRARALFLKGTLSSDAKQAEEAYLAVVLSYPSSPSAAAALLRLGQGFVTAGEPLRAVAYLERLRSDYPGSPHRETGWVWLARAQLAAGAPSAACAAAREGLASVDNANLVTLLELERDNACGAQAATPRSDAAARTVVAADPAPGAAAPVRAAAAPDPQPDAARPRTGVAEDPAPAQQASSRTGVAADPEPAQRTPSRTGVAADPEPAQRAGARAAVAEDPDPSRAQRDAAAQPPRASAAPAAAAERSAAPPPAATSAPPAPQARSANAARNTAPAFTVQTAAFRERVSAEAIVRELRAKGFAARIVLLDGSPLFRVRYGEFPTREQALAAARRIRDAGFEAFVVDDVRDER